MPALIFDCDGVLADTERNGHLPAFNATFDHFGLPVRWNVEEYGRRLKIGGGKERLASLFNDPGFCAAQGVPDSSEARADLVATWHRYKTAKFTELVSGGNLPSRPGITRIIVAAVESEWTVAVASTSAVMSVRAVLEHAVGQQVASKIPLFAGDAVPVKKPDPAIYCLAKESLQLDPRNTLVIEDSRNGLLAATGAGFPCLITVNDYTREEDFSEAVVVVSGLGDPDEPAIDILANRGSTDFGHHVTLDGLAALIRDHV